MAKYNIYAVAYGIDPKTKEPQFGLKFKTWDECKPYVVGIEGAKYKGFLTDEEADKWIEKTIDSIMNPPDEEEKPVSEKAIHDKEFVELCTTMGVFPRDMALYLEKKFVEEQKFISVKASGLPWD